MSNKNLVETDSHLFAHDGHHIDDSLARLSGQHTYDFFDDEHDYYDYLRSLKHRGIDAEATFAHEKAHADASHAVGIGVVRFGMKKSGRTKEPIHGLIRHGAYENIPRIALGAVLLAPVDPSSMDMDGIGQLGYESPAQVHGKIQRWNEVNQLQLPLPGSLDIRRN